jgi:hypothetical protein
VAGDAQGLAVGNVIPITALGDRHDVIGLGLTLVRTDTTAGSALPRVSGEHGTTPRSV